MHLTILDTILYKDYEQPIWATGHLPWATRDFAQWHSVFAAGGNKVKRRKPATFSWETKLTQTYIQSYQT